MPAPAKPVNWSKQTHSEGVDPKITPWTDEEYSETLNPPQRKKGRTLRDYIVLGLAFLLVFYVVMFLLASVMGISPSSSGSSGFSFLSAGEIAVIPIQGEISSVTSRDTVGYQDIVQALDDAENDPAISVIFLDIDSGGGSVVSSKQMVAKIRDMNKPVVSWIGEVGASGAYYIAASSDYILADSDSITGSIGVISMQPNIEELMQKIGVKMNTVKTGELKDIGSPFNEMSDEEKEVLQNIVNEAFDAFKNDVQTFRGEKLDAEKFSQVLDGRILSGRQALSVGLIDETGTREQALARAAESGGITGKPVLRYYMQQTPTLWDVLFSAGTFFGKGVSSGITSPQSSIQNGIEAK